MRIWTDNEHIEVEPNDVGQLEAAMLFKAEHIKAKADPELFAAVADMLSRLWDSATKRVDVVRCRECKHHYWEQEPCHGKSIHYCKLPHMRDVEVFKDFFCYYGEKRRDKDGTT